MLNELANDSIDRRVVGRVTPNSANTPFDIVEHTATDTQQRLQTKQEARLSLRDRAPAVHYTGG